MGNCRICGNRLHGEYEAREMMFGFRDKFLYSECSECGCLQINAYPPNMQKYYPQDYYSFSQDLPEIKTGYLLRGYLYLKYLLRIAYLYINSNYNAPWPVRLNLLPSSKVLDIGCGNGSVLFNWLNWGLNYLNGIDKYIQKDISVSNRLKIIKGDFYDLTDTYEIVMMHHTLEHLPNQEEVFRKANQLLCDKGLFFIRIPVKSWAWYHYGINWVQLDAPRHFYLHSEKSIAHLAGNTGFKVIQIVYDSWELQFTGSEKYKLDFPLHSVLDKEVFSEDEMMRFKEKAIELNRNRKGDQAAFVLRKISSIPIE